MHNGYWNDGWNGPWSWILMAIMMIMFWGGLVWLVVTLTRRTPHTAPLTPGLPAPNTQRAPQDILAERFASGQIDPEDYRQRLQALRDDPTDR